MQDASHFKSKGGLTRIRNAIKYSVQGLRAAWKHEAAFRQEVLVALPLLLMIPVVAMSVLHGLLLLGSIALVFTAELLNSAMETVADELSSDLRPLIGRAKDLGSAAVFVTLIFAGVCWAHALGAWVMTPLGR